MIKMRRKRRRTRRKYHLEEKIVLKVGAPKTGDREGAASEVSSDWSAS